MTRTLFLFAHGAGAASTHPWMARWKSLLGSIGAVTTFDYPYLAEGRKRPDPLPQLVAAHRAELQRAREQHDGAIVLVGKSMGGRVGCHLSLEEKVTAVICLGYPLCGGGDVTRLRDKVLRAMRTPVLFVQGTRDALCPIELLQNVRREMAAPNELVVVEGGDHSLLVSKTQLKANGETQEAVEERIVHAIGEFVSRRIHDRG